MLNVLTTIKNLFLKIQTHQDKWNKIYLSVCMYTYNFHLNENTKILNSCSKLTTTQEDILLQAWFEPRCPTQSMPFLLCLSLSLVCAFLTVLVIL